MTQLLAPPWFVLCQVCERPMYFLDKQTSPTRRAACTYCRLAWTVKSPTVSAAPLLEYPEADVLAVLNG